MPILKQTLRHRKHEGHLTLMCLQYFVCNQQVVKNLMEDDIETVIKSTVCNF